jgi:hypothetical protein
VCGERHGHRPGERHTEIQLWQRKETFEERIRDDEHAADQRQQLRDLIQRQGKSQRHQAQATANRDGLDGIDRAGDEWPVPRALHVTIEVAIGEVVDRAAGRAREDGAEHEYDKDMRIGVAVR